MRKYVDIPGYEGHYQINRLGEVRSLDRITTDGRRIRGKQLNTFLKKYKDYEYVGITLRKGGVTESKYPHIMLNEIFGIDVSAQEFVEDWKCRRWLRDLDIKFEFTDAPKSDIIEEEIKGFQKFLGRLKFGMAMLSIFVFIAIILTILD